MCIRDSVNITQESAYYGQIRKQWGQHLRQGFAELPDPAWSCLLYTSDAADERSSVDLGGRRIIKKQTKLYR